MKFALKMIALISILLALSLSVGGVLVVRNAFRSEMDTAVSEAQEDMKLFSTTLQALCIMEDDHRGQVETMKRVLLRYSLFGSYRYWVYDSQGQAIIGNGTPHPEELTEQDAGIIETRVRQRGERYEVCSTQRLTLLDQGFVLERDRDISAVVEQAKRNLRHYRLVMLGILLTGILLTTLLTLWMTRPIRRISRTAKQLSDGRYDCRVKVQSDDELGQLAQDFNRMADALEGQIHALEDAAQRQRDFTASFAHELKTPLTSVIGYADTLRSRVLPPRQQMEAASYIFSEGKRLEAMSFALLDLFALERETPAMTKISPLQLAGELRQSLEPLLQDQGMELRVQVEPGSLTGAPELLKTLLYNLIDNARKASKAGDLIRLSGQETMEGYCFAVEDQGRGIPPEALPRVTEAFYMVDKSRARAQGGAGLGLALCQRIAEAHHGSLRIESQEGRGTTVRLWIGGAGDE